jgi:Rad3-related DNA helicase
MGSMSDHILKTVTASLATEYLPNVVKDHERLGLFFSIFLLGAAAEETERAAHRRIEENNALREIFAQSLPVIEDKDLKSRLQLAVAKTEVDYRVTALDELNCELQEALIDLHAHVETLEGDRARAIEKAIWQELEEWTKRRESSVWDMAMGMLAASAQEQALNKEDDTFQ